MPGKKEFFGGYIDRPEVFWGEVRELSRRLEIFLLKISPTGNLPLFHFDIFPQRDREKLADGDWVIIWQGRRRKHGRRISVFRK